MIDSRILIGAAALCAAMLSVNAEAKLYKWVDDKGTTHYGETIPPEYANRDTQTLDKGRIKDRDATFDPKMKAAPQGSPEEIRAAKEVERRDNALLNTYSNEKEIDLARDRNLLQVEARVNSYTTLLKSAETTLADLHKEQEEFTKKGRKIPASLTSDIAEGEALVAKRKMELENSKQEMEAVKARYAADKQRYRELKGFAPPPAQ
ncbi:MAG: DUF4124 domain-containing protein [Gammaproteobacteria bacterium]|nr:DUF4124 domain-containing protein [Gammaproteobacteria bacterium]MBU1776344.1 DUF4124 domain-containing protein [Gammaproteobacteria bacterium]MBU1968079.1 DUF4124 domain-containing protein [Gammaproteobacteria bacterium]